MSTDILAEGFSEQPLWWPGAAPITNAYQDSPGSVDAIAVGGCGIVMMSWLGRQVVRKILGTAAAPCAFEGLAYRTRPLYAGKPRLLLI